jgi:DNA-binding beta-propeller fold protein YncE
MSILLQCNSQQPFGEKYLQREKSIALPNVKGRIDHLDVDIKNQILFVAALGNNTVEVVDLQKGNVIHSIAGVDEPQGIGYVPQTNEILVANGGNGDCDFFNVSNFKKTATIHLSSDADDVRYDSAEHKLYVGYGEGGIAVIDAISHTLIGDVKLPAHPEGFQLFKDIHRLLVNVPDKNMIGVIDLQQLKLVAQWTRSTPTANFPMAVDSADHLAFIGYRHPAKLIVLVSKTGKEIGATDIVHDTDDVYYEPATNRVYVSGGGGYINIFQLKDGKLANKIANIPTSDGARTSLLIAQLGLFVVAERAVSGSAAQLIIYSTRG